VVLRADTHVDGGDDAGVEPDECERAGSDRRGQTGPVELRDRAVAGRRQDAAVILADAGRSGGRLPGAIVEQRVRIGVATTGTRGMEDGGCTVRVTCTRKSSLEDYKARPPGVKVKVADCVGTIGASDGRLPRVICG